ncbi:uncharacterized protein LOC128208725 [Mya arenaria]|uniref:uncharacterized protein LOC128208725 n=1 Tax=Mya arenaria TaxID=6604 RepID=UPI0022E98F3D|nr:uncharacterized protein LOC128208725 [Mya arenaria]
MIASAGLRIHGRPGTNHFHQFRTLSSNHNQLGTISTSHGPPGKHDYRSALCNALVSVAVMIAGIVFTVMGFVDIFGSGVTLLGMLMIAVAVLIGLYALRLYLIAGGRKGHDPSVQAQPGTVASMVIEREDECGTLTVVMDTTNMETTCQARLSDCDQLPCYHEATADMCMEDVDYNTEVSGDGGPESSSDVIINTGDGELPPPYYQAMGHRVIEESTGDLTSITKGQGHSEVDDDCHDDDNSDNGNCTCDNQGDESHSHCRSSSQNNLDASDDYNLVKSRSNNSEMRNCGTSLHAECPERTSLPSGGGGTVGGVSRQIGAQEGDGNQERGQEGATGTSWQQDSRAEPKETLAHYQDMSPITI